MRKKNGNHAGSINERKDRQGKVISYQAQVSVPAGRKSATFKTKGEARAWITATKAAADQGRLQTGGNIALQTYLDSWLLRQKDSVKPSAYTANNLNVRRIANQLGKIKLEALTVAHVQALYDELSRQGLAPRTVRQVHSTLHKALKDAINLDMIVRNVTESAKLPRVPFKPANWYSKMELNALFAATTEDRLHALWVVLGTTGIRLGEALGLLQQDISFNDKTIRIERALQRLPNGGGLAFVETKSKHSRRTLKLTDDALKALSANRERMMFEARQCGEFWQDRGLVFASEVGGPLDQSRVNRRWTLATKKAGVPRHRIHDLRHSVASMLIEGGMSVHDVAAVLGHSDPQLVLQVYGHAAKSANAVAAETMEHILAKARSE